MKEHNLNLDDFELDEITSIELIGEEDTIDISVEDTHMFYANDIYTHNSSIKAEIVESDQIGGSIKKGQIGHFIVSIAKSLAQKENNTANIAILKSRFGKDGVVFRDAIFHNGVINIEIVEGNTAKSFLENQNDEVRKKQQRVNLVLDAAKARAKAIETDDEDIIVNKQIE